MPSHWMIDALQVVLISGFCSLVMWVVVYTLLAPWWRNPIGRTLVAKTVLIAALLVPTTIGLYFPHINHVAWTWVDIVLIGLITPVMLWRTIVWLKLYKLRKIGNNGDATSLERQDG